MSPLAAMLRLGSRVRSRMRSRMEVVEDETRGEGANNITVAGSIAS
jgi:hypothetical protein